MARQLNVNLVFNANVSQAKQQMNSLQTSISQMQNSLNSQISMNGLTAELSKAQNAVISLKANLNSAFDVNTGKLDLTKFNQNLQRSGMTLKNYRQSLQLMGSEGQRAFNQLTQAIVQGQMPLHKTNNLLTSMMNTFGSSIKWSIAYGAINKISQGFSNAFQYAKDLNESLTNIRVVTGKSTEEMAKFAEQANRAAKDLGTTTTAYTDAALIYYQQGLEGKAVEERAKTTLKLANVTGQTAETVSDQMTAVWNNFYDGSKSLEYYADVLTALGAATASSTDEISDGLEKFAAIAETVGLSYEYATTALATVTAETRQSADVVGTAFKTLFARIQDLELGKTLEDGTTLGAYSEALAKVGVNIKTASGDLKDMDTTLNEMAATWSQLDNDQQVALAKSVAGIRQYTQLIALMDNWDSFEVNLAVAEGAEGTLQEQQDIWAESWEAASNRVRASAEDLYKSLINDDFFINLNNVFADLLSGLDEFIDAIGGLKTLLPMVGAWMLKAFGPATISAISNFKNDIMGPSKAQQAQATQLRNDALKQANIMAGDTDTQTGYADQANIQAQKKILAEVENIQRRLNNAEVEEIQFLMDINKQHQETLRYVANELELIEQTNNKIKEQRALAGQNASVLGTDLLTSVTAAGGNTSRVQAVMETMEARMQASGKAQTELGRFIEKDPTSWKGSSRKLFTSLSGMDKSVAKKAMGADNYSLLQNLSAGKGSKEDFVQLQKALKGVNLQGEQYKKCFADGQKVMQKHGGVVKDGAKLMAGYTDSLKEANAPLRSNVAATKAFGAAQKSLQEDTNATIAKLRAMASVPFGQSMLSLASGVGSAAAGFSMLTSGIQSVVEMFKTGEHTISGWLGFLTSVGFALPMVANGIGMLSDGIMALSAKLTINTIITADNTKEKIRNALFTAAVSSATDAEEEERIQNAGAIKFEEIQLEQLNEEQLKSIGLKKIDGGTGYQKLDGSAFNNKTKSTYVPGNTKLGTLESREDLKIKGSMNTTDFKTGLKNFGTKLGQAAPAIIGIAVAAGAVAAAVTIISKSLNKEADAMKAATEAASQFKQEHEKVAQATEQFKNNINSYKEATNALNDLTTGTLKYQEALLKANEQALDLIQNHKDLKYTIENGQIIIDQASMDTALETQLSKQRQSLMDSTVASQNANYAKAENKRAEYNKDIYTAGDNLTHAGHGAIGAAGGAVAGGAIAFGVGASASIGASLASGATFGAALGSVAPGMGTAIGALIGLAVGAIAAVSISAIEGTQNKLENAAIKDIEKMVREQPDLLEDEDALREALKDKGYSQDIVDALTEDMDALRDLIESNEQLRLQNIALNENIAALIVQEDGREEATGAVANYMNSRTVEDDDFDEDWELVAEAIDEEDGNLEDLYALFYDKETEGYITNMSGTDVTRVTYDEHGTPVEKEVDQETIAREMMAKVKTAALEGDQELLDAIIPIVKDSGSGEEVKDIIDKYTITAEDRQAIYDRYDQRVKELTSMGFDKTEDSAAIATITSQLEGSLEDIDFSSLTREQIALIQENQNLWKSNSELNDKIQKGINEYEIKRTKSKLQASIDFDIEKNEANELQNLLSSSETTMSEFTAYQKLLQKEYGISEDNAYGLAKANLNIQSSITSLNKIIQDNSEVLSNQNANNIDYAKGLNEIATSISSWLGVELDSDFVDEHLEKIKLAAEGDKQAIKELQDLASEKMVVNLDLAGNYEQQLLDFTKTINSTELTIGMNLDTTEATKKLGEFVNQMIIMGQMTTEQGVAYLQSMGFEVAEDDLTETKLSTSDVWKSDRSLWEKIQAPFKNSYVKTINLSSVQYSGEGQAADLSELKEINESAADKKKRHKNLDEEIERYRLLNETVEDLERNLDNIGKAKDRAYGGAKIGYMQAERKELERNIELAKERLRLAEEYYQQDLQELSQYGIRANKDGQIENWDEILQKQINKMKGMDPNNDAYENEEQRLEDMKSAYDKYMQSLDDVKDAQQEIIDNQNAVIDSLLEEAEFTVEFKIEADEFTMEVLEHFLSRLEDDAFAAADAIALIGQQMEVTAGQIDTYMTGINKVLGATLSPEEIQKVMAGDLSGIDTSKLTEQQIEDLKEYVNGLMEVENQLREQHIAVHEKLTETIEAWNEEFDKNMAKFEKYNAVVENYKNIIDIVGKGTLGISDETMRNMYEAQKNIATDQLEAARIRKESAQATYDEMKIAYDNAVMQYGEDSEIAKKWKEQMDIAEESLDEATSEFQDAWQNALQAAADAFQHNVETIIQNFEKSIAGIYGSLQALEEAMERQKEINERYLQDYEKTYEINKLNRKITQDIAKTTSNKSAKELRDLQNELLEMSKEGNQISKLDVEYIQKKYDLLLAEQALRDAQNAKSTVKLSRDSEGNYSYVYTADQNNVDQAMQTYEDAKYALEDWSRTSLETVSENIIQIYSAWSQTMQEIMMDNTLNEEERERKMAETNQYYLELMGYYTDEAAKLTEYGYQTNSQYHTDMADSINDSIVGHIMPDITDWKDLYTKYSSEMEKATNNLNGAILQLKKDIDTNFIAAGRSASTFETTMNQHLLNVQTQAGTTKDAIVKIKTEAETQLPLAVNAAKTFETQFNSHLNNVISRIGDPTLRTGLIGALLNLTDQCKNTLEAQYAVENKDYSYIGKDTTGGNDGNTVTVNNSSDTTQKNYTPLEVKTIGGRNYAKYNGYWYTKGAASAQEWSDFQSGKSTDDSKFYKIISGRTDAENSENIVEDLEHYLKVLKADTGVELTKDTILYKNFSQDVAENGGFSGKVDFKDRGAHPDVEVLDIVHRLVRANDGEFYHYMAKIKVTGDAGDGVELGKTYWVDVNDLNKGGSLDYYNTSGLGFDTGGYTGSWGPEGRLAMLHQKEIVLNAHDTENLLSIISMVRDMSDRIELNARAMQYGLTAAYTANNIKSQNDTLQQEVHITAEFPNATNHSEIEEAFRNLTNLASQYANRKF